MATLLLDRADLELRSAKGTLALYEGGERRSTIPLPLIERVVIQGRHTKLDTGVLLRLAEAGVTTLLLSPRTSRHGALILGPRHNDAAVRLAQAKHVHDLAFCERWALQLVQAKVRAQCRLLDRALNDRPDARKPLYDALTTLGNIDKALKNPNGAGTALPKLRGIEGAAARAYFRGFAALFAPTLGFEGRNRRPPRDPVNACLSLGYTMLHFEAVHAAHVAGLDPLLGFYHRPAFGRESLASDLIEVLRPKADAIVWTLFRERTLRADHFVRDGSACLLSKAGRERFYAQWDATIAAPRRWLRLTSGRLARLFRDEGKGFLVETDEGDEGDEGDD